MSIFPNLPDHTRVWIYQSNKAFSDTEVAEINEKMQEFVAVWVSHSQKVIADGAVLYNRFIILVADESAVSIGGCSIDSSVKFIKELETAYEIDLFDRMKVAYKSNGEVNVVDKSAFQQLVEKGEVTDKTLVFNNLVSTKKELESNWEVALKDSWHKKVFSVAS